MFSQWRQNLKSLYYKLLTLSCFLPLTFQFTKSLWSCPYYYKSLFLIVLDTICSSSNKKKNRQFTFSWQDYVQVASALSAQYIWKESGWKCGWERIRLVSRQAVSIASTMIFIIRTLIITVYIYYTVCTTDTATNKVFCLLYFGTQCEQSTHQIDTQKCNFQHSFILRQACRLHRNENFKLYTSRPHNSFVSRIQRKVKLSCVT